MLGTHEGDGRPVIPLRAWIIPILAALTLVLTGVYAKAAELHDHTHEGPVGRFYQSWMMPDNRAVSCCHDQDCAPAEAKMENGRWFARHMGTAGDFTPIPRSKIEQDRDSPDGRNHLCARRDGFGSLTVFCFLPAIGG